MLGAITVLGIGLAMPALPLAERRAQILAEAEGVQPGTVTINRDETLIIAPYNDGSDLRRFKLPAGTLVLQGRRTIRPLSIRPGMDVRIYYAGVDRHVVGVELLTRLELRDARLEAQHAAPLRAGVLEDDPPTTPGTPEIAQLPKAQILATASGSRSGLIDKIAAGRILLGSRDHLAQTLEFDESCVPVYDGDHAVGWRHLKTGSRVRVYFDGDAASQVAPRLRAIEILRGE